MSANQDVVSLLEGCQGNLLSWAEVLSLSFVVGWAVGLDIVLYGLHVRLYGMVDLFWDPVSVAFTGVPLIFFCFCRF